MFIEDLLHASHCSVLGVDKKSTQLISSQTVRFVDVYRKVYQRTKVEELWSQEEQ